jgi:hypothetical protein
VATAALLIAGPKGLNLLRQLGDEVRLDLVSSYRSKGTLSNSYDEIVRLSAERGVAFCDKSELNAERYSNSSLVICSGWQYMLGEINSRLVVLHRGFAPTVSALIAGDERIGVTAFKPLPGVDTGDIIDREVIEIAYPITIREAYEQLGHAYAALVGRLLRIVDADGLQASPQIEKDATYSLWRDEDDYEIDWTRPAEEIRRFIDALGWPYFGARTWYRGSEIRVAQAEQIEDLTFVNRQPGKIWAIGHGRSTADIVCGSGLLRILDARTAQGEPVRFDQLRQRLER